MSIVGSVTNFEQNKPFPSIKEGFNSNTHEKIKEYMVTVIETLEAPQGKSEELKRGLLKLVPLSRQEPGCISYELFQDRSDGHQFAVIMCWKDHEAYEAHCNAPFIDEFVKEFDNKLYRNVVEHLYTKLS